ncbi:Major facilitator superfamily MFS_1 [Nostocoides japonicum T1-X7]|uniref:Major facilitator superfamily MFS_1 n=1 Tax=Nostocoides japonicum T1-X7 TaxID=1194083 RepID=A0A077LZZ2_9MICO|nr:MFS transporter [Tetrasphaera japonica]CCH79573.1 Major facilitator superfamily MFS_1 [Tetrasphaera japonica T1-X7]
MRTDRAVAVPHAASFWLVAAGFLAVMSFTTIPTPLYPLYQAADHFAPFMITVVFAAYGVGVIAGLFLLGHVSDRVGRRRMILTALVLELVSAVLFTLSSAVPTLLVARFVCGFGIGIVTAAATAHLTELHAIGYPDRDGSFASTVATVVNTGGLALGPLVGGLLTQWWPHPLTLPFAVYLGLLAVVALVVWAVPETVSPPVEHQPYRPQRVEVDPAARGEFAAAAVAGAASFTVLGLYTSLTATFVGGTLHDRSRLLAGTIVFAVMGASAVSQVLLARLPDLHRLRFGGGLMVAGLLGVALGATLLSLGVFVAGGILAGGGAGLVFQAAIATAVRVAAPGKRAETMAGMFLAAYIGITVPVVAVGVALTVVRDPVPVLVTFSLVVLLVVVVAVGRMLRALATTT